MKRKLIIFVAMMTIGLAYGLEATAQTKDNSSTQGLTKEQVKQAKKKVEAMMDSIHFNEAAQAIKDRYFIMTVNSISYSGGGMDAGLSESTNYILVQDDGGIFQTAHNYGNLGANGLGGITVPGRVGNIKYSVDKKGNISASFTINGSYGSVDVNITIPYNGQNAQAWVSPTMWGGSITMYGTVIPFRDDSIRIDR